MYAALWRALPGPWWAKALQALALAVAVVAFCFLWLFPRIERLMPFNQTTVETGSSPAPSTPMPSPQPSGSPS